MAVHFSIVYFTHIEIHNRQAMAISKDGSLYVWGSNEYALLGLEKLNEIVYIPTVNEYFKKFKVKQVSCGMWHSLIYVNHLGKNGKEQSGTQIFAIGRPVAPSEFTYLGITEGQSKVDKDYWQPWHLKQFNDFSIKKLATGLKSSFMLMDPQRDSSGMSKHMITPTHYEEGILHFYFDENKQLVKVP